VVRARRQREDDLASTDDGQGVARVTRGRKGVSERLHGRRAGAAKAGPTPTGADLLSDEHSELVDLSKFGDDPSEYFDDAPDEDDNG
jgi:hypothetical protein